MKKIVILGTATIDIVIKSKEIKVHQLHEALKLGSKLEVEEAKFYFGGGAMNVATALKRWRLNPYLFISLGKDEIGQIIKRALVDKKINCKIFWHKENSPFSIIILAPTGERTILVYRGSAGNFSLSDFKKIPTNGNLYYLTSGQMTIDKIETLLKSIKKAIKILNPSKNFYTTGDIKNIIPLLTALIMNEEEYKYMKLNNHFTDKDVIEKFKNIILVITHGNRGGYLVWENKIFFFPAAKVKKVVDKTGAGDAFSAGFVYAFSQAQKINFELITKALNYGAFNAASVIQKPGAQEGIASLKDFRKIKPLLLKEINLNEFQNFLS